MRVCTFPAEKEAGFQGLEKGSDAGVPFVDGVETLPRMTTLLLSFPRSITFQRRQIS